MVYSASTMLQASWNMHAGCIRHHVTFMQDVVLFKSGYEAHVRQQDRTVPPIPSWLETWDPMQDCKVKQVTPPLRASGDLHVMSCLSCMWCPVRRSLPDSAASVPHSKAHAAHHVIYTLSPHWLCSYAVLPEVLNTCFAQVAAFVGYQTLFEIVTASCFTDGMCCGAPASVGQAEFAALTESAWLPATRH